MDTPSLTCPVCGFINLPNTVLCVRCQSVLQPETHKIEPPPELNVVPKFGEKGVDKKLYLHVERSGDSLQIDLEDGKEFIIGRFDTATGQAPEIDLSNYGAAEKGVSRKHVLLTYRDESLKITDLDSANYTYLNNQKLIPHQPRILRDGDEIRLGRLLLTVQFG